MNYDETLETLTKFQYYYPNQLKTMSDGDIKVMVNIWQAEFKSIDKTLVLMAFELYVNSEEGKYFPSINAIKNQLWSITSTLPSTEEAWQTVKMCMSNPSVEHYQSLTNSIRDAVGGYSILKGWSQLDTAIVDTSISKQFKEAYRKCYQEEKQLSLLPQDVRKVVLNQKNDLLRIEKTKNTGQNVERKNKDESTK